MSSRSPYDQHIVTVQAIDRDAVGTGVVRYKLVDGQNKYNASHAMFGIHEKFGVISNKILMREYAGETFMVTVNARDRISEEDAESANTSALVGVRRTITEFYNFHRHSKSNLKKLQLTLYYLDT